uniref:pseudaminic acid cytidylyltransferase n=1 Tax=Succinivibrio sp. TaxID=2053619 RepID=UPI00402AB0A9
MSKIAVIPARGGSKRIPLKNIKEFNGAPLISYSIKAALESKLFDKVVVSTDDEKIASVAKSFGAEVPFLRDKSLADDFTGTFAVVKDAYLKLKDSFSSLDTVCCIYATAPLLKAKHLQEAYNLMQNAHAKSVISICEFPFPIQRAFVKDDNGNLSYREPKFAPMRSQDLQKCYQDCGLFYFYDKSCFEYSKDYQSIGYAMPRHRVIDIDTPEDWDYACAMAKAVEELKLD